ncbi:MAG: pyridoxine 5'-phosphate synthase [Deltaproteobacteria bacterium]
MTDLRLGVNVDHVATIRQARLGTYPDPLEAALAAERGGAGGITVHLREDRRHIQEADVVALKQNIATKLNLEMAAADEIVEIACRVSPPDCCLVPERREELTTEGGLSVHGNLRRISTVVGRLQEAGITVSLFINPDEREIRAAAEAGATVVELHTGAYADAAGTQARAHELTRLQEAAGLARGCGLVVNGGHGLNLENVAPVAAIEEIVELNIGHSIVARSMFVGIQEATREMLEACHRARQGPPR